MSAGKFLIRMRFDNSKFEDITGNTQWDYENAKIAYNDSPFGSKYKCCATTAATEVDLKSISTGSMAFPVQKGLTIAFWVYRLDGYTYSPKGYMFIFGDSSTNMIVRAEPNYDGVDILGEKYFSPSDTGISNGTWHHIVISCNKTIGKYFVDGQLKSTSTNATSSNDRILNPSDSKYASFFFIKGSSDAHNYFQGSIFDFAMIQAPIKNIKTATTVSVPTDYITADFTENVADESKLYVLKQY